MDATEICPLTKEAIIELLSQRTGEAIANSEEGQRRGPRWPFPGPVELWLPCKDGVDEHVLATCENLSPRGVGILCDRELDLEKNLAIAIHQPEMSLHGRAWVRHCTPCKGEYYIGMEFNFEPA